MPNPETTERTEYRVLADGMTSRVLYERGLAETLAFEERRTATEVSIQVRVNGGPWVDLDEGEG